VFSLLKDIVRKALSKTGYAVLRERDRYHQDGVFTVHGDHFRACTEFREAYCRGIVASHGVDEPSNGVSMWRSGRHPQVCAYPGISWSVV